MQENDNVDPILFREPSEESVVKTYAIPDRALNVEAATLSLLEQDDNAGVNNYSQFQNIPRDQKVEWLSSKQDSVKSRYDAFVRSGLTSILADTKIPPNQRVSILEQSPNTKYAPDDSAAILKQAGAIAPSAGETDRGAAIRTTLAEQALKSWQYIYQKQEATNAALAKIDGTAEKVIDTLSMFLVPLQDSIVAGKIAADTGGSIKRATALPGSFIQDMNKQFLGMNPDERLVFAKSIAEIVQKNSGILSSSNQLRVESLLENILNEKGMSNGEVAFTNIMNLLDLVGVGVSAKSLVKAGGKAAANMTARRAEAEAKLASSKDWFSRTGRDIPMEAPPTPELSGEATVSTPQVSKNAKDVKALQEQLLAAKERSKGMLSRDEYEEARSSLSAVKNNKEVLPARATPADVEAFYARKQEQKRVVEELQTRVNTHEDAVKATDEIGDLQNKIEKLQASDHLVDAPKSALASAIDRAYVNGMVATTHPRAPANILSSVNFEKGQTLYAHVVMDETGQMAEALHGTTRTEAIVSQISPQFTDELGKVTQKMDNPERVWRKLLSEGMGEIVNNVRDGIRYTPSELAAARSNVVKDFTDATGMELNDAMTSIQYNGDRITFKGTYTNGQGGWASSEDALSQARYAMKNRSIADDDIELLRLEGDDFVPVKKEAVVGQEGVYAIRINVDEFITDKDVTKAATTKTGKETTNPAWDALDVKRNWIDRFFGTGKNKHGSVHQHLFEPNSSLHKTITGSFAVAEDKSSIIQNALLNQFKQFSDKYVKLDKVMKGRVDDYIIEANVRQLPFDYTAVRNQFPEHVADMLQDWRNAWDGMWMLENFDVMRSLNIEGYQMFKHANIEAVVRKASSGFTDAKIYDPATDTISKLTEADRKALKANGGYIGEFRAPMNLNGQEVSYMIVRNTPTEYARVFNNQDRILNYRHGYYQVSYKAPRFIEETDGVTGLKKVVQVTGSTKRAQEIIDRLKLSNPNNEYRHHRDERKIDRNRDVYWELNSSFGRIAQRHRGKLLEDTVGMQYTDAADFIANPVDSAVRASMSMGGRIAMRDALTTAKNRFIHQYSELLTEGFPRMFPASLDQIYKKGDIDTKELADARTTWNYINSMENGYINAMDEAFKMGFNHLADLAGLKGFETVEKILNNASEINVTGNVKGAVFGAYMASHPMRQWLIQGAQGARLAGYSGIHLPKVWKIMAEGLDKTTDFRKFMDETGMIQSLHRNNLVRGTLLEAAGRQSVTGRMADKAMQTLRKVGFDLGEGMNTYAAGAAVWERYAREGKDLADATVRSEMHREIRAVNRNMNRAGDMPYNNNFLALLFTYAQVPHKFALQWADRTLMPKDRARLIATDLTMWGLPAGVGAWVANQDFMQEFPELKEIVEDGVNSFMVNHALTSAYGDTVNIDWSSMAPYDLSRFGDIAVGMVGDKNWGQLISESPAGRVLGLGIDSRLGFAVKTTAKWMTELTSDDIHTKNIGDVVDAWARISSGWTSYQEAVMMYNLGMVVDKQGRIVDDSTNLPEVAARVLGFGTRDTKKYYETTMAANDTIKKAQQNGKDMVKESMMMIRHTTKGDMMGPEAIQLYTQLMSSRKNFPNEETYKAFLSSAIAELKTPANQKLMKTLFMNIVPENMDDMVKYTNGAPLSPEAKEAGLAALNSLRDSFKQIHEANKGN